MKRTNIRLAVLAAAGLAVIAGAAGNWVSPATSAAQLAPAKPRTLPVFEVEKGWPKIPAKWKIGDGSHFAVDAQDNVWLVHRPRTLKAGDAAMAAPPMIVFDNAGNFLKAWGGAGSGYEWPEREHGIHVDNKGFVWITGNNCPTNGLPGLKKVADDQILKFTQDGKFVMQIGKSNQSKGNADTQNVHRAADLMVFPKTNELFVADGYGNHRVVVFDADSGKFKRMWGAFGEKPMDDDNCEIVAKKSFPEGPGPKNFSIVHAIRVAKDGTVYVADRENRRVQMFTAEGKFLKNLTKTEKPFARNVALSADPEQQFLYVGNGDEITVVDRKTLEAVGSIKLPGQIGGGHEIATDSKGNIYIAGTGAGIQKLTFKRMGSTQ